MGSRPAIPAATATAELTHCLGGLHWESQSGRPLGQGRLELDSRRFAGARVELSTAAKLIRCC
jgi:hypothetical protein